MFAKGYYESTVVHHEGASGSHSVVTKIVEDGIIIKLPSNKQFRYVVNKKTLETNWGYKTPLAIEIETAKNNGYNATFNNAADGINYDGTWIFN